MKRTAKKLSPITAPTEEDLGLGGLSLSESSADGIDKTYVSLEEGDANPYLDYDDALIAAQQGNLEAAKEKLHKIIAHHSEFALPHCLLGEILYTQKDFHQALLSLETSISLDQNNAVAHLIVGKIFFEQKNLSLATAHLSTSKEINPQNPETLRLLGETHRLMAKISSEHAPKNETNSSVLVAERALRASLALNPDNNAALESLQNLLYDNGKLPIDDLFAAQRDIWKTLTSRIEGIMVDNNLPLVKKIIHDQVGKSPFRPYGNQVDGKNAQGATPLQVCAGSLHLIRLLVETYGADVNEPGRDLGTAVTMAAGFGNYEGVTYLASKGAYLGDVNHNLENILHVCVRDHRPDTTSRNLIKTIKTIFKLLWQDDEKARGQNQDHAAFQVSLVENASEAMATGTTLLLQLLTKRNRYKQTVIELADSLSKYDLVGIFREQLALLINERLGGLINKNTLFIPVTNNELRPLILHNPQRAIALFPLFSTFLTKHVSKLPGSYFCPDSPACRTLNVLERIASKIISMPSKQTKKAQIVQVHVDAAQTVLTFIKTLSDHGIVESQRIRVLATTQLSTSEQITPPALVIVPQANTDQLKEKLFSVYRVKASQKIQTYCHGGTLTVDNQDIYECFQHIRDATFQLRFSDFTGAYAIFKQKLGKFANQLNKEVNQAAENIKRDIKPKDGESKAQALERELITIFSNKQTSPGIQLLYNIFEEFSGAQLQIQRSNYGWAAAIEKTRKEQTAAASLGS